jgi:type 2 lantibiotic biosynthesis protein LanM
MKSFYERLIIRAATIDEILSDAFEPLPGQKGDADVAARRLAAWCRSCASGDWSLFNRRLERDRLSIGEVLARFATVRRDTSVSTPPWVEDAIWIEARMRSPGKNGESVAAPDQPFPFEHLFTPVVEHAEALLWAHIDERAFDNLSEPARACLRELLLKELCNLSAPAIYERFAKARKASETLAGADKPQRDGATSQYDQFVADMKAGGFRRMFEDKPVLLRLIASITRQWIEASREFVLRLDADLATIRRDILRSRTHSRVEAIEGDLSDPHNNGRSVQIVRFEDGSRVVYKPKDLCLDAAWYALVERLNKADAPVELKAVRALTRDGYGWTEFADHAGCADADGCKRFFRRSGAWLALFHCFAGTDMHQENMIAAGDHPVPIDLEMILQATSDEQKSNEAEAQAFEAAVETISNSVMMVGLLPAYGKSPENKVFAIGGMTSDWTARTKLTWNDINSDTMRPAKTKEPGETVPNLPHIGGRYAKFGDHLEDFVGGFEQYANFLMRLSRDAKQGWLFEDFAGLTARKVVRPTRFYYMLLQRLKNHRTMDDGVVWSAQADFLARLSDWENETDSLWPLQRAERSALLRLNVPHFVSPSDDNDISDAAGISVRTEATAGLHRARARVQSFDEQDIAWQVAVVRENTSSVSHSEGWPATNVQPKSLLHLTADVAPASEIFVAEADKIADDLAGHAVRRGPAAAWIGRDWLGDSEVSQLVVLGPDLYNGNSGIALFLAAHSAVTGRKSSADLALAAIAHLRKNLKSRNGARMARLLGIGGGGGLGSIVYALAVISKCLRDDRLLTDAHVAAARFTDDLIAADKALDIMGGSAGAILGLLRLYRDSQSADVLERATKCGEHLLAQPRRGADGRRSWIGQGIGERPLNGMSHGAAGFAYALACLAAATGREDFATAASECIVFENSTYDAERANWPDLRGDQESPLWATQWCHGAPGIGLGRIATSKCGAWDFKPDSKLNSNILTADIRNALAGVEHGWPGHFDTLCCGTLGSIEFFCEASDALGRSDLRAAAARRMMAVVETAASAGDYRWNAGKRRFNLGLFRGVAGVGYTCLRQADASLPNVLIWE